MSDARRLAEKLGLDVFKPGKEPHIRIRPGKENDPRLRRTIGLCPAGLYCRDDRGQVALTVDGCLECGTCRVVCGTEVLEWAYPEGGCGVQFRFG